MNKREKLLKCLNAPHGMNRVYFGGIAMAKMSRILGIEYGKDSAPEAIRSASEDTIERIYADMGKQIEAIWYSGINHCQPEQSDKIWVRLGVYRTTPPPSDEGWVEYTRHHEV